MKTGINQQWHSIWEKKGTTTGPLHHVSGYDLMSKKNYSDLIKRVIGHLPAGLANRSILDCGCGSGAFLDSLQEINLNFASYLGIDYSSSMISRAQHLFPQHNFKHSSILELDKLGLKKFSLIISFGVFFYLDSAIDAESILTQMVDLLEPGGTILVGEVSDLDKVSVARNTRKMTHKERNKIPHLYLPKQLFVSFASRHQLEIKIIDHCDFAECNSPTSGYRFSAIMVDVRK